MADPNVVRLLKGMLDEPKPDEEKNRFLSTVIKGFLDGHEADTDNALEGLRQQLDALSSQMSKSLQQSVHDLRDMRTQIREVTKARDEALSRANESEKNAQEKAAALAEAAGAQRELEEIVERRQRETDSVRALLGDSDEAAQRLRAEMAAQKNVIGTLNTQIQALNERHKKALEQVQRPVQIPAPPPMPSPEAIDLEYHRNVNGYLTKVVLRSDGYEDVAVEVVRGSDNLMKDLIARKYEQ